MIEVKILNYYQLMEEDKVPSETKNYYRTGKRDVDYANFLVVYYDNEFIDVKEDVAEPEDHSLTRHWNFIPDLLEEIAERAYDAGFAKGYDQGFDNGYDIALEDEALDR